MSKRNSRKGNRRSFTTRIFTTVKKFFTIEDKWYLAVLSIIAFAILVLLATEIVNKIVPDGSIKNLITSIVPPVSSIGALLLASLTALFGSKDKFKEIVDKLGKTTVLTALIIANIPTAIGYNYVTQPCYGISPANIKNHEILVLLAPFSQENNVSDKPSEQWTTILPHLMKEAVLTQNMHFAELDKPIPSVDAAKTTSDCHGASMLIWGTLADGVIDVKYDVSMRWNSKSSFATMETYLEKPTHEEIKQFIRSGGDLKYVISSMLAKLLLLSKEYDKAISYSSTALNENLGKRESEMSKDSVWNILGSSKYSLGDFQSALYAYNQAISINPNKALYYQNRGVNYYTLGRYADSISDLTKAIDLQSKENGDTDECACGFGLYISRSAAYSESGNMEAALNDANTTIEQYPEYPDVAWGYLNKSRILLKMGYLYDSLDILNMIIGRMYNGAWGEAYFTRAQIYYSLGKYAEARSNVLTAETDGDNSQYLKSQITQLKNQLGIK